tara:strand:- start:7380 stop:7844 length:465 start_codon:yes stop_codon:yes gene_type:complete
MLITYLIIGILLFLCFKYDLKQNTIKCILRAILFVLLAYVIIEMNYREGLAFTIDDQSQNDITLKFNKIKKKKKKKKACKYFKKQRTTSIANFNNQIKDMTNYPDLTETVFSSAGSINDIDDMYSTQFDVIQDNFDDLYALYQLQEYCEGTKST